MRKKRKMNPFQNESVNSILFVVKKNNKTIKEHAGTAHLGHLSTDQG